MKKFIKIFPIVFFVLFTTFSFPHFSYASTSYVISGSNVIFSGLDPAGGVYSTTTGGFHTDSDVDGSLPANTFTYSTTYGSSATAYILLLDHTGLACGGRYLDTCQASYNSGVPSVSYSITYSGGIPQVVTLIGPADTFPSYSTPDISKIAGGLSLGSSVFTLAGGPLYQILVAFIAMGIAFLIFYFAWSKLHNVLGYRNKNSPLYESFKVKGDLDTFYGRRNRLTGRTRYSVFRGGTMRDAWTKKETHKSFIEGQKSV